MGKAIALGALMLLTGCATQRMPSVIDMPYCDANTMRPAVDLSQIERTDSTTELTFMATYFMDIYSELGDDINLTSGDFTVPLKEINSIGNTVISQNKVLIKQGVPSQFKMIFPALPENITTVDLIQKKNGKMPVMTGEIINQIWGIDLTGKRSPEEFPAEIPSNLLKHDLSSGNLPRIVRKDGVVKINAQVAAWRDWMSNNVDFYVNTIDDTQEKIPSKFDKNGHVSLEIPVKGTAWIFAITPYNVCATFYADPGEEINLYIMPINRSETQNFTRPNCFTDGKYRNIAPMDVKWNQADLYAPSNAILINKTNTDDYVAAIIELHSAELDSIKAFNFEPDMEKFARARIDDKLIHRTLCPDAYINAMMFKDEAKPDTVLRFSPDQIKQIRSSIDTDNPLLELLSIGNSGDRSRFLLAKKLILDE